MSMQRRSDERSKALHREIAKKLRRNPKLWDIPINNLSNWKRKRGKLTPAFMEWEYILHTKSREQILAILEGDSEECIRLRSSSPFTGILDENERKKIFKLYRTKQFKTVETM